MRTYTATTVTVGSGRSIHWGSDCGTFCGAAHRSGFFTEPNLVNAETATCKRCIKIMVIQAAEAHELALETHQEVLDAEAVKAAGVEVGQVWTSQDADMEDAEVTAVNVGRLGAVVHYTIKTGERAGMSCSLSLAWFVKFWAPVNKALESAHAEALAEQAQRIDDAERAAALAAPSDAYPAAVALDTWLTEGLVLVGPATDSLFIFQRWHESFAVLLHLDTQETIRVAQADIVNWRYLPCADAATLAEEARAEATPEAHAARYHAGTSCVQGDTCPFPHADRVKAGDRIQFVAGGDVWTVREVEHHAGTDLYSFGVRHSVRQFVRHATEQVRRVVALETASS